MAQPQTIARVMTPSHRLVLTCRKPGCGQSYVATQKQAIKRFGAHATSYTISQSARCPACRGAEIDVALANDRDPAALPSRDVITYADVQRLGLYLAAECAPCRCGLAPGGAAIAQHRFTPLARLFAERVIRCHKCGLPVCGLSVERHAPNGGSMREGVHAWWVPGSPSDPVVLAFWRGVRASIAESSR